MPFHVGSVGSPASISGDHVHVNHAVSDSDLSPEIVAWHKVKGFFSQRHESEALGCIRKISAPSDGTEWEDVINEIEQLRKLVYPAYRENIQSNRHGCNHVCILDESGQDIFSVTLDDAGVYAVKYGGYRAEYNFISVPLWGGGRRLMMPGNEDSNELTEIVMACQNLSQQVESFHADGERPVPHSWKGSFLKRCLVAIGLVAGGTLGYAGYRCTRTSQNKDFTTGNTSIRNQPVGNYNAIIMADPQAWRLESGDPNAESNREPWLELNKKVADALKSQNADFYIVNGDLTEFGREKTYDDYRQVYTNNGVPVYEGLGNHDYANNAGRCMAPKSLGFTKDACAINAVKRMISRISEYSDELSNFSKDVKEYREWYMVDHIEGSLSYSWDYGDIHYVQLHNHPLYSVNLSGLLTNVEIKKSLDWLSNDLLEASSRGKVTIINIHDAAPAYFKGESKFIDKKNLIDLLKFKKIISSSNVTAIFAGHTHKRAFCLARDDTVFGDIPVYTAGALFNGDYYLINVEGKDISVGAYNGKTGSPVLVDYLGYMDTNLVNVLSCSDL